MPRNAQWQELRKSCASIYDLFKSLSDSSRNAISFFSIVNKMNYFRYGGRSGVVLDAAAAQCHRHTHARTHLVWCEWLACCAWMKSCALVCSALHLPFCVPGAGELLPYNEQFSVGLCTRVRMFAFNALVLQTGNVIFFQKTGERAHWNCDVCCECGWAERQQRHGRRREWDRFNVLALCGPDVYALCLCLVGVVHEL